MCNIDEKICSRGRPFLDYQFTIVRILSVFIVYIGIIFRRLLSPQNIYSIFRFGGIERRDNKYSNLWGAVKQTFWLSVQIRPIESWQVTGDRTK